MTGSFSLSTDLHRWTQIANSNLSADDVDFRLKLDSRGGAGARSLFYHNQSDIVSICANWYHPWLIKKPYYTHSLCFLEVYLQPWFPARLRHRVKTNLRSSAKSVDEQLSLLYVPLSLWFSFICSIHCIWNSRHTSGWSFGLNLCIFWITAVTLICF